MRSNARVLIVDGQVSVAHLVAKIFRLTGLANVDVAFDTLTARNHLETQLPDIVVLDARVSPTRATAFITLVRRLTHDRALIFVMTTSKHSDLLDAAIEAGVSGHLLKPFSPSDLQSKLVDFLN
jgi:PleD family two-component response regulator